MRILQLSRIFLIPAFLTLSLISNADILAQKSFKYRGSGHVYYGGAAPMDSGAINYPVGIGGGGEVFLIRGLTASADFGYYTNPGYSDVNFRLFSANLGYHFMSRSEPHRIDPFVVGGWGLLNERGCNCSLGFGGGGLDAWFQKHIGFRLEGRMYVNSTSRGTGLMTWRAGLLFR